MSDIQTRIPETFPLGSTPTGDGVYAWGRDGDGNLVPTGNTELTSGQAWEYDVSDNLVPTGEPVTDDPYWEYNGDGDLVTI